MRSFLVLAHVSAAVVLAALTIPAHAQDRSITVTGRGEVNVAPDKATASFAVQQEAEIAADALDQASAATSAILATLDQERIPVADIQTGSIRLNPRYNESLLSAGNQIIGYQAVNSIEVTVNDLDRLGEVLAAVVGDGANRLGRMQFGLQDPLAAQDEVRRRAVAEGMRLAALYAQASGVRLGELISLGEGGASGYRQIEAPPAVVTLEGASSSPRYEVPIAAGEITLNATVTMVFAIEERGAVQQ